MVLFDYDLEKMLYVIPPEQHDHESVSRILEAHPEVRFVSLVGIDIGGHDTDEKIPTAVFLEDFHGRMGKRKMRYDLVTVRKGDLLVNMDSQAPNKVVAEALAEERLSLPGLGKIVSWRGEYPY